MKQPIALVALTLLCLARLSAAVTADDFDAQKLSNWHQWRGPLANGVAPQGDPPIEWSETKNVQWKVPVPGQGSASPIVWNDRIYLLSAAPVEGPAASSQPDGSAAQQRRGRGGYGQGPAPNQRYQFLVLCYARNTGRELWRRVAAEEVPHEPGHPTNTFASASAVTDGQFVYASFGSRGIFCYDLDGNLQWKRNLGRMQTRNGFGEGASPALYQGTLVVPWDHEGEDFIVALDARTGKPRWRAERDEPTTWATPLVVEHAGRVQVVTNGNNRVRSYDLKTGELLWECGGQAMNPIPSPVAENGLVYCMTGFRGYAVYAIPLDARGDVTDSDQIAWRRSDTGPYISSPVLYGGQLYFTKERNAVLWSLDAKTGEPLLENVRLQGLNTMYASPVAAAGRVYFTSREGATIVLKHGPKFQPLATNRLDEGIDASPAIVGAQMFLRGERSLYCIAAPGDAE